MLEAGRRSAVSTSELGLYSDRGDRYGRSRCGLIARKFAIGVMVVVTVILVAIFTYDFTSATSGYGKTNQETKHIYILQNALKKSLGVPKRLINSTTVLPEAVVVNQTDVLLSMQDRSDDDGDYDDSAHRRQHATDDTPSTDEEDRVAVESSDDAAEYRAQNLHNFKQRKRILESLQEDEMDEGSTEAKRSFDNHAIVYRVRQRYKHPDSDEDMTAEEAHPVPFHWEYKTPHPMSFKRPRYPQLSQYRYPQASRNIQDIIKYLTSDAQTTNRGIKFTGVYVNPKKYDLIPGIGEMVSNSDRSETDETSVYPITYSSDPFYRYRPRHPADVNLLAPSNVRFSPTGLHRYNPYYDSLYGRPLFNKPIVTEPQYDSVGSYSSNALGKSRKPKPFSVMLDIYPITDIAEQNKKTSWPRPQAIAADYDPRRPLHFNQGTKYYAPPAQPPIPLVASPTTLQDEEERQQMILHLNLYPRKKNKLNRQDIIHKSESMDPEERQQFVNKITSPLESIAKHLTDHSTIEESKYEENGSPEAASLSLTRYQETSLDHEVEKNGSLPANSNTESYLDPDNEDDTDEEESVVPSNHKSSSTDEDYASTKKYEIDAGKVSTKRDRANCDDTTTIDSPKENESADHPEDIDTIQGFQRFNEDSSRLERIESTAVGGDRK